MPTGAWEPGTLYIPGTLVRPRTTSAVTQSEPLNADFEGGNTDWTLGPGFSIGQFGAAFNGTWSLKYDQNDPAVQVSLNDNVVPVTPGLSITASAQIQQGASPAGQAGGQVLIRFYDASMVLVLEHLGNLVNSGSGGQWKLSTLTVLAPPGAAFAQLGVGIFRLSGAAPVYADVFIWNYTYSAPPEGLLYKAVQALSGYSAAAEPVWPIVVGNTVVDNEVTWEAVLTSSRVIYEAHPILESGDTEPDFPDEIGSTVADGTIVWEAVSRQIEDEKCPHSKIVAAAASKIFAADGDIIAYSATTNPLDWTTRDDAGYLPFGLRTYGSAPVAGLGLYRSNLVAFNAIGAQMWQVDEDPSNMALLDAVPVGCEFHKSIQPVGNDLEFVASVGIRNFGIAAASTNLQAGDAAKPLDPLVKAEIDAARVAGYEPIGLFFPGTGQYMVFFGNQAFVLTLNGVGGGRVSRSRYVFPQDIDNWTILDGALYLRAGDLVWRFDEDAHRDDAIFLPLTSRFTVADSSVQIGTPPPARHGFMSSVVQSLQNFGAFHSANYSGVGAEVVALYTDFDGPDPRLILVLGEFSVDRQPLTQDLFTTLTIGTDGSVSPPDVGTPVITLESADADFYTAAEFFEDENVLRENQHVWVWYIDEDVLEPLDDLSAYVQLTGGASDTLYAEGTDFEGYISWPYLELRGLGGQAMLHGFDLVGSGQVAVSFGYEQRDFSLATDPYTIQADTVSGMPIAMPISAPSVQLRLTFTGNQRWSWTAAKLYDTPVP